MFLGFVAIGEGEASGRLVRPGGEPPATAKVEASAEESDLARLVGWLAAGAPGETFTPRMVADVLRKAGVPLEGLVCLVEKRKSAGVAEEMSSLVSFGSK